MKTILIACKMLEDEIELAMQKSGRRLETEWIERSLHDYPNKLRDAVQKAIAGCTGYDTILLAMARCGNSVVGIESMHATLVLPNFHDCLNILLSKSEGDRGILDKHTMYFTRGWFEGDRAMLKEYRDFEAEHGTETAREVYKMMMAGYRDICMIDTGAYDLEQAAPQGHEIAEVWELGYTTTPGTVRVLEKLLAGTWDEEFLIIPPGGTIREEDFRP